MGRKHKHSSYKYIKQENENLKTINESLRIMSNNAITRDIESRKKVVVMEEIMGMQKDANDFLQQKVEILETQQSIINNPERNSSFGSALMLACSVKVNNIESEESKEGEDDKIKIFEEVEEDREDREDREC